MKPWRAIPIVVAIAVGMLSPAASFAATPVDPSTLTPPPPAEFNPVCRTAGGSIICDLAFADPPVVNEPFDPICDGVDILISETRDVVGKRYYDGNGLLLRRHFHEIVRGTLVNAESGASVLYTFRAMNLHDLAIPGEVNSGTMLQAGDYRAYLPSGRTVLHDVGSTVFDAQDFHEIAVRGQHPFYDFFVLGHEHALDALCAALTM